MPRITICIDGKEIFSAFSDGDMAIDCPPGTSPYGWIVDGNDDVGTIQNQGDGKFVACNIPFESRTVIHNPADFPPGSMG